VRRHVRLQISDTTVLNNVSTEVATVKNFYMVI